MHMCGLPAGTEHVESEWAAHARADAPLLACDLNSGQAWLSLALMSSPQPGTPGREKGPFQKYL